MFKSQYSVVVAKILVLNK